MKYCLLGGLGHDQGSKTSWWSLCAAALCCETRAELNKCRRETLWNAGCQVTLGKPHVQKHLRGVIFGHRRSHQALLLDQVGVRWASHHLEFEFLKKKKLAREELGRELGNSFSHVVQILSSAESESTVWKLTSDEGPESGGSKSAPTLSWWNTILLTGQFQSPDTGKRLVWTGSRGHGVGSAPSTLLNCKCYSLILSVLSPTSSIIHRWWLSLSFQTFEM